MQKRVPECMDMKLRYALAPLIAATATVGAAPPDLAGFEETVVPYLEEYCLTCHDTETQKGNLSLEEIDPNLQAGDDLEMWRMVFDQVHFREMPPAKKKQPSAGETEAVLAWLRGEMRKTQLPGAPVDPRYAEPKYGNYIDHAALFGERLARVYPSPPRIWRLRDAIYDRVVPSLSPGERIGGLANGLGMVDGSDFKDYAVTYFVDEASTSPLLGNAKKVAVALLGPKSRDGAFKALVADEPPGKEAVDAAVVLAFQRMLGRRPTAEEQTRFHGFHERAKATGGHRPAAKALLTAVLMQPEFLYREELGDGKVDEFGRTRLAPREIGYSLSYALTDAPVKEFLDAAEQGGLATREQVAALVRERLTGEGGALDLGGNPRVLQFFREYFNYRFANEVFKDSPEGAAHNASLLVSDLEMTVREIVQADRDLLRRLLTTREYYVNVKIETKNGPTKGKLVKGHTNTKHYHTAFGLPMDWKWSAEQQPVTFREDERAGVLTHPAWLAAWSGNFENHPVQRGKWIRTHLLGGTVPDVPIGVDARVPEIEHVTYRDRLKMATEPSECWRCHRNMDPLGVGFERFDHYGRVQRVEEGQPIDASCEIDRTMEPSLHRTFPHPAAMMDFLAESEFVEQVFVRHVFRFYLGRNETLGDANTMQDAHRAYRESDGSFRELVVSLLSSDSFLLRSVRRGQ